MKSVRILNAVLRLLAMAVCLGWLWAPALTAGGIDQTLDVLQIGTVTYQNVTVTTKGKNYIFILHSKGMTNIKVAELSDEVRVKLGYEPLVKPAPPSKTPADWARQTLSKFQGAPVQKLRSEMAGMWLPKVNLGQVRLPQLGLRVVVLGVAGLLGLYLFHCYCCMLICLKCGKPPGLWIWLPLLQILPLLHAAGMSLWWFLGFIIPGVNVVAYVVWCFRITQARRKGFLCALFMIFPLSSPLAVLYLAFSDAPRPRRESRRIEIMTLETA